MKNTNFQPDTFPDLKSVLNHLANRQHANDFQHDELESIKNCFQEYVKPNIQ